jgi:hypothetical protein
LVRSGSVRFFKFFHFQTIPFLFQSKESFLHYITVNRPFESMGYACDGTICPSKSFNHFDYYSYLSTYVHIHVCIRIYSWLFLLLYSIVILFYFIIYFIIYLLLLLFFALWCDWVLAFLLYCCV